MLAGYVPTFGSPTWWLTNQRTPPNGDRGAPGPWTVETIETVETMEQPKHQICPYRSDPWLNSLFGAEWFGQMHRKRVGFEESLPDTTFLNAFKVVVTNDWDQYFAAGFNDIE